MSGYCHFNLTGNQWVDHILNMVTAAGNSFHHTREWQETDAPDEPSCIEIIDAAAAVAADHFAKLEAERDATHNRLAKMDSVLFDRGYGWQQDRIKKVRAMIAEALSPKEPTDA